MAEVEDGGAQLRSAAQALLLKTPLKQLAQAGQSVFALDHTDNVSQALKALAKKKIQSAPLVVAPGIEELEESGRMSDDVGAQPTLLGWIDMVDLLKGLLLHIKAKHPKLPHTMLALMPILEAEGKTFCHKQLVTLHGTEDRGLVYQGDADASLLDTLRTLFLNPVEGAQGRVIHRLALFDAQGAITHVVSQLDVIRFLAQSSSALGPLAELTVGQLRLLEGHPPVVTVDPHVPTILAYEKMLAAGVSAAAVVNEKAEMVANLSVSDLRTIQPEHLGVLALPVAEFLALLHRTSYLGYSQRSSAQADHPFFAGSPKPCAALPRPRTPPTPPRRRCTTRPQPHGRPAMPAFDDSLEGPGAAATEPGDIRLISVQRSSSLAEVLRLMSDNHVHRVYVLEPSEQPQLVGVVTPTDILRWIAGMPRPPALSRVSLGSTASPRASK